MRRPALAALGLLVTLAAGPALAAVESRTVAFTGAGFADPGGVPAPQDPASGGFTLTLDLASSGTGALDSLDLVIDGVAFAGADYVYDRASDILVAGSACDAAGCALTTEEDGFYVVLRGLRTFAGASIDEVGYASGAVAGIWTTTTASVTVTPLPAALPLLAAALGGLAVMRRPRRG